MKHTKSEEKALEEHGASRLRHTELDSILFIPNNNCIYKAHLLHDIIVFQD